MQTCQRQIVRAVSIVLTTMLAAACGGTSAPPKSDSAGQATTKPASQAASKIVVQPVKACSLLKKNETDSAVGRSVLEPVEEQVAELSTCSYGDPQGPMIGGRSLSKLVVLSVFNGGNSYYAGPVAQVAEVYDMGLKNAGEAQTVSGLGDKAFWANHTLHVLRGPYLVEVEVRAGDRDREMSEQIMKTALQRLPSL